jgi:hypothetical protein
MTGRTIDIDSGGFFHRRRYELAFQAIEIRPPGSDLSGRLERFKRKESSEADPLRKVTRQGLSAHVIWGSGIRSIIASCTRSLTR